MTWCRYNDALQACTGCGVRCGGMGCGGVRRGGGFVCGVRVEKRGVYLIGAWIC